MVTWDDLILVVQRGRGRLWEEFWEFPTIHVDGPDPAGRSFETPVDLSEGVRRLTGMVVELRPPAATVRYSVTRYRVTLEVSRGQARSGTPAPGPGMIQARWVEAERLAELTFSSAGRRILAKLAREPGWPGPH